MRNRLIQLTTSMTLTCLFSVVAWAQTDTGRIVGTVKDATGAVIPGAMISVVSDKTAQERTTTSNESGGYVVTALPAATYTVKASNPGLTAPAYKDITLQVGHVKTVILTLQTSTIPHT